MRLLANILSTALFLFFLVLMARIVFEWVRVLVRDWRPKGLMLIIAEAVYTITDPPVKFLRRIIPPLNLGRIRLDLSIIVLFIAILILMNMLTFYLM